MSRSASPSTAMPFGGPLLQQLDPLARSAPLVSQQSSRLNPLDDILTPITIDLRYVKREKS